MKLIHATYSVSPESPESPDYVELALQASCAALMALQGVRRFATEDERSSERITLAIAALRHAIDDLRDWPREFG